jgi:hypothetical protein
MTGPRYHHDRHCNQDGNDKPTNDRSGRRSLLCARIVSLVIALIALCVAMPAYNATAKDGKSGSGSGGSGSGSGGSGGGGGGGGGGSATTNPEKEGEEPTIQPTTQPTRPPAAVTVAPSSAPPADVAPPTNPPATNPPASVPAATTPNNSAPTNPAPTSPSAPNPTSAPPVATTAKPPTATPATTKPKSAAPVIAPTIDDDPIGALQAKKTTKCGARSISVELKAEHARIRVRVKVAPRQKSDWDATVLQERRIVFKGLAKRAELDQWFDNLPGSDEFVIRLNDGAGAVCTASVSLTG